jgi:hypothetical protein
MASECHPLPAGHWPVEQLFGVLTNIPLVWLALGGAAGVAIGRCATPCADTYYNLLVQGFRAGQLSLKKEVPPGLAQLADPYDPDANAPIGIARPELLQGEALPLFWGYARLDVVLAVSSR